MLSDTGFHILYGLAQTFGLGLQKFQHFLLLLVLICIKMFFGRSLLPLHASLNLEAAFLQMLWQFVLQFFERGFCVNIFGAQSAIWRNRHMQEVHMRRFFIHVHHCRDDIFLAYKFREILCRFLKKAPGFIGVEFVKKFLVRTDNQPAHMHSVLTHRLDHEQIVNSILDSLGIA